jgi:5-methylcytosine-specific restriction endonuclease McrA
LPSEKFGKNPKATSGLKSWCRDCHNEDNRRYFLQNKEKVTKKNLKWARENKEKASAISKKSKAKNPLHHKAVKAKWHQKNMKKSVERNREWLKENPGKSVYYSEKRRARKLQAGSFDISSKDIEKLQRKPCVYCGSKMEHIDHVIPLARGGGHRIGNLAPACRRCNQTKSSSFVMEWKQRMKVRYN